MHLQGELPKSNSGVVGVNELSKSNSVAVKTVKQLHINLSEAWKSF